MRVVFLLALVAAAMGASPQRGDKIAGEYVVVLKAQISNEERALHMTAHVKSDNVVFEYNFGGSYPSYAIKNVDAQLLTHLESLPEVRRVEPNVVISIAADLDRDLGKRQCNSVSTDAWGLQRTSLSGGIPSDRDIEDIPYEYHDAACGEGVEIHVQDTGVLIEHEDFDGRAEWGGDWTLEGEFDGHGHGTHVASTAAGKNYGLARCAKIVACKVMTADGIGNLFGILGGLDHSAQAAEEGKKVVINMSLGALWNPLLNEIADDVVRRGTILVAAAGNANEDACGTSPASAPLALCVGSTGGRDNATRASDIRSDFSNFGSCVDIFAPGGLIKAAWIGANDEYFVASGTSMACPHGAGVAAKYWSRHSSLSNMEVKDRIIGLAQVDLVRDAGAGSPNKLLYMDCDH